MNSTASLTSLSPLDGRYYSQCRVLGDFFSEWALMRNRLRVEIAWLRSLSHCRQIIEVPPLSAASNALLEQIVSDFDPHEAATVKAIEKTSNHDVKAIEYYLKSKIAASSELAAISEFVHFACTSEDINNVAWATALRESRPFLLTSLHAIVAKITAFAREYAGSVMLAKTHGQPASPTTMGKEMANVVARLKRQIASLEQFPFAAKMNGASGNYNAHLCAYPEVDWVAVSVHTLRQFNLHNNPWTTQIEPHDGNAEYFHNLSRINTVLLDLSRDIWGYISFGLLRQKPNPHETGSSTMPHKVNPIDFENAEGNLGIANALLSHLASSLPVSRFQRDLSDSTAQRNMGVALGHAFLAWKSIQRGLEKLKTDEGALLAELEANPQILTEAVQTVMRRYAAEQPYETLKAISRGKTLSLEDLRAFIRTLNIPDAAKQQLLSLRPQDYIGSAARQAKSCD